MKLLTLPQRDIHSARMASLEASLYDADYELAVKILDTLIGYSEAQIEATSHEEWLHASIKLREALFWIKSFCEFTGTPIDTASEE